VNAPNVQHALIATNAEHVTVVAIAVAAMTIEVTTAVITASLIVVAEQSLPMENS
jgi:hypothetical protein